MSDYTLNAKITVDNSRFVKGMEEARAATEQLKQSVGKTSQQTSNEAGKMESSVSSSWDRLKNKAQNSWQSVSSAAVGGVSRAWNAVRTNASELVGVMGNVAGAGVAAVAGIAVQGGFDRALAIDNAKKKLAGFGHDVQDIESIMNSATTAVRGTAFGLGDAATTAATLSAAGIKSGQDMTNSLQSVANVASAAGRDFNSVGTIFSSVAARGKLMGDDMLQLTSSGVPVLQLLGSYLGKTSAEVSDMVSKGQIDFQTFSDAMRVGLGDSAQASGNTFQGAAANVRAALSRMTEPLMNGIIRTAVGVFKQLAPAIDNITKAIGPVMPALAPVIAGFVALKGPAALAGVITHIPVLSGMLGPLSGGLSALSGPVGIAVAAFLALAATNTDVQNALGEIGSVLGAIGSDIASACGPALQSLWESFQKIGDVAGGIVVAALQGVADVLGRLYDNGTVSTVIGGIANVLASVADAAANFAQTAAPYITGAIDVIADAFSSAADFIAPFIDWLTSAQGAGETFQNGLQVVVDWFTSTFAPVFDAVQPAIQMFSDAFATVGDLITGTVIPAFEMAWPAIQVVGQILLGIAEVIVGVVLAQLQMLANFVGTALGTAFTVASSVITGAMTAISGIIQAVIGVIQAIVGTFVGIFTGNWQMASTGAQNIMNGLSGALRGIMNGILGAITGVLNGIGSAFSNILNGVASTVSSVFSGIANTIGNIMGNAKNTVSNGLNAIANFFRGLHIEFPKIKLPHFHISGSFSLAPPSVPTLGIEWYSKGAVLTQPTIFGMNGSNAMVGGEAGPEAVAPIDTLKGYIANAVSVDDTGTITLVEEVRALREDVRNMKLYMDGEEVGGVIAPEIDKRLGEYKVVASR